MMKDHIKRILVPLDPSIYAQAATESACLVAKAHYAQLAGVAVLDSEEIRRIVSPAVGPYYPLLMDEVRKKTAHADAVLKNCMAKFADTCESLRVAHLETEYEGLPVQKLLDSAIFYDLIVVGIRTAFHFETSNDSFDRLDQLLDHTITPILAVPATGLKKLEKVVIAFDGSLGSARALHDFAALAGPFSPGIKIVTSNPKKEEADFLLDQAAAFLRSHGLTNISTEKLDGPIEKHIDELIADGPDLIVAGIHSKKLIGDRFVGSFTKSLINRADIALFLSH